MPYLCHPGTPRIQVESSQRQISQLWGYFAEQSSQTRIGPNRFLQFINGIVIIGKLACNTCRSLLQGAEAHHFHKGVHEKKCLGSYTGHRECSVHTGRSCSVHTGRSSCSVSSQHKEGRKTVKYSRTQFETQSVMSVPTK